MLGQLRKNASTARSDEEDREVIRRMANYLALSDASAILTPPSWWYHERRKRKQPHNSKGRGPPKAAEGEQRQDENLSYQQGHQQQFFQQQRLQQPMQPSNFPLLDRSEARQPRPATPFQRIPSMHHHIQDDSSQGTSPSSFSQSDYCDDDSSTSSSLGDESCFAGTQLPPDRHGSTPHVPTATSVNVSDAGKEDSRNKRTSTPHPKQVHPSSSSLMADDEYDVFSFGRHASSEAVPDLVALTATTDELIFSPDGFDNDEEERDSRLRHQATAQLASAVFAHPRALRAYCIDAHALAKAQVSLLDEVQQERELRDLDDSQDDTPETHVEPRTYRHRSKRSRTNSSEGADDLSITTLDPYLSAMTQSDQARVLDLFRARKCWPQASTIPALFDILILHNVPVSVTLDLIDSSRELSLDTSFATVQLSFRTTSRCAKAVLHQVGRGADAVMRFNPLAIWHILPFNEAVGKTTEVVVGGIQSVGSASSLALYRLSSKVSGGDLNNDDVYVRSSMSGSVGDMSISSLAGGGGSLRNMINQKLLRKLSAINSAAPVVSYRELEDDTGGLSMRDKSRVQRMMHYDVSLRPFVATVKATDAVAGDTGVGLSGTMTPPMASSVASVPDSPSISNSPFMCTPQSFPPTPASRRMVLARSTRFSDDVVFLARDQLRVHDALESENDRTREMAHALCQEKRLAVFDCENANNGIEMTCGQHVATKVAGNMLYCSTRSMVPILRNCFVYFEMSVLPRRRSNATIPQHLVPQASMATLSIGLSTKKMPPNTLVGAWKGSIGLCTTGQILSACQWCTPINMGSSVYSDRATVGCLVCLDDSAVFETCDGVMVTAAVTFSVNGRVIHTMSSPSITLPLLVPAEEELYPTVTIQSPATAVMCRFSAEDMTATQRLAIGAPDGVTVYAVDGSVFMD